MNRIHRLPADKIYFVAVKHLRAKYIRIRDHSNKCKKTNEEEWNFATTSRTFEYALFLNGRIEYLMHRLKFARHMNGIFQHITEHRFGRNNGISQIMNEIRAIA